MNKLNTYDVYYDEEADFLEVSFDQPAMSGTTEEVQTGVFVTRDIKTNNVTNVGILSFKKRVNLLKIVLTSLNKKLPIEISVPSS
ncbi:MAG: hypothetical protein AABX23_04955 [Nanoarchaeota archaeon]